MCNPKLTLALAAFVVFAGAWAGEAEAQLSSRPARGSLKVQPRFFNPFDVSRSRLSMDRFGNFSIADPDNFPFPLSSSAALRTQSQPPAAAIAPGSSSSEEQSSLGAAGAAVLAPETSEESLGGAGSVVRPPFRPPVRSPFRPPPRPPFFPL